MQLVLFKDRNHVVVDFKLVLPVLSYLASNYVFRLVTFVKHHFAVCIPNFSHFANQVRHYFVALLHQVINLGIGVAHEAR